MRNQISILLLSFSLFAQASVSLAQAPILGGLGGPRDYGSDCLYLNDDGSSDIISLEDAFPSGLRFFDRTHSSVYVNTNGNITFSGSLSRFTPDPFPVADQPMIAPFWADVDIREPGSCSTGTRGVCSSTGDNSVWWHLEPGRMIVTWDNVGYYRCDESLRMNFQLILTAVPGCGGAEGDFDVEFRYNRCEWETGDASGGTDGFGGTEAQAGFDAGNEEDFVEIDGSREPGISAHLCESSNVGETGVWRYQIRAGAVICPDAGESCDTGEIGICGEGVTACVGGGTECVPVVGSSDELCDAVDNDCDGTTDEGDLCPFETQVCDRGRCIDVCFEGSCPDGQACLDGQCIDIGCEDLECPDGQRCVAGECVGACAGIACPVGQDCVAGRCLDLCEDLTCDPECSVCDGGACVARCDHPAGGCLAGETCLDDGRCEPTACVGVDCGPGMACTEDGCVDACEGAVCPGGEVCRLGECVNESTIPPDMPDAGPGEDGGVDDGGVVDGGDEDAGADAAADSGGLTANPRGPRDTGGCDCHIASNERSNAPLLGLVGLALVGLIRRRRR